MITERLAYTVKHNGRYKTYATKKGALSRLAWWLIFDKYEPLVPYGYDGYAPEKNKKCECIPTIDTYGEFDGRADWMGCPIHDRNTGYYKRLHDRYVRYWLKHITPEVLP